MKEDIYTSSVGMKWTISPCWVGGLQATDENYEPGNEVARGNTREECVREIEEIEAERMEREA